MSGVVSEHTQAVENGKSLPLAVLLAVAGAALIFVLSGAVLSDEDFIGSIYENGIPRALAGFFLLATPFFHQKLARKRRLSLSGLPDRPVTFAGYTLPDAIVLAYGVLIAFAAAGLSMLLVWMVGQVTEFFLTRAISSLSLVVMAVVFFNLGAWVGNRSGRRPGLLALAIVFGYVLLELLVSMLLSIDSPLRSLPGLVIFVLISAVAALLGVRKGRRRRLSSYSQFILGFLPEPERYARVDDLYRQVVQGMNSTQEYPEGEDRENEGS